MKTVYIARGTEDLDEDMDKVKKEFDFFLNGTKKIKDSGLSELADILGA